MDNSIRSERTAENEQEERRTPANGVEKSMLTVRKEDPLSCDLCGVERSDRSNES